MISSVSIDFDPRVIKIATSFKKSSVGVTLVCPWIVKTGLSEGIFFIPIPRVNGRLMRPLNYPKIWKIINNCDHEIFYFDQIDILPLMALFKILKRKSVVFDMRENYAEEVLTGKDYIPILLKHLLSKIIDWLEKTCVKIIKNLIVVVNEQEQKYAKYSINLIKIRNYASLELEIMRKSDYSVREPAVLFIGGQTRGNGSLLFLEIVHLVNRNNPKIKFLCTDYFFYDARFRQVFCDRIRQLGLENAVAILPFIVPQKIMMYINMATIGIVPNLNIRKNIMAIPMKTFEYMAGAIPVIASNHPYLKEFLGDNNAGLLANPEEPRSFADHILFLTSNPSTAKAMGENGLRAFREKYCWDKEAPRLIEYAKKIALKK